MNLFKSSLKGLIEALSCGILVGLMAMTTSCSPPEDEGADVIEKFPDRLVARVASVHSAEGYVLVQRYGKLKVEDNTILYSMSADGEVANLKVTGERLGQFLAADIQSGVPQVGDAIYLRNLEQMGITDIKDSQNINKNEKVLENADLQVIDTE